MASLIDFINQVTQKIQGGISGLSGKLSSSYGSAQPQTPQFQQVFQEATKNFTPQAMERARNVPVQYTAETNKAYIPGGIHDSGLVWGQDHPLGMYGQDFRSPSSAGISLATNMNKYGERDSDILRHELIHSMDRNINTPKMSLNPQNEGSASKTDPILEAINRIQNMGSGAYLLNSQGLSGQLNQRDRNYLGNFGPKEYSQSDAESMAFLNQQEPSAGRLSSYYNKAIQYPENTVWSQPAKTKKREK